WQSGEHGEEVQHKFFPVQIVKVRPLALRKIHLDAEHATPVHQRNTSEVSSLVGIYVRNLITADCQPDRATIPCGCHLVPSVPGYEDEIAGVYPSYLSLDFPIPLSLQY